MTDLAGLRVLVIEDEETMRAVLESRLAGWGLEVLAVPTLAAGEESLATFRPSAVVSDVKLPDGSGVDLLDRLNAGEHDVPVIFVTAHATVELAVQAMRNGALHFLTKPLDYDRLRQSLEAARLGARRRQREASPTADTGGEGRLVDLVGVSKPMRDVFASLAEIAPTDVTVLLTGESGTGKELAARAIHTLSRRRGGDFVAVNSAAIPTELMESEIFGHEKGAFTGATGQRRGCFELAHGGTLLLDEIAEMPVGLQPKLLRVLEDRKVRRVGSTRELEVDVRVVAATNRPPREAIDKGLLREDLYYRLNVFEIRMPPLRERPEDIEPLVDHFVERFNKAHGTTVEGIDDAALDALRGRTWTGNVRELRNMLERAVVLAKDGRLGLDDLAPAQEARPPAADGGDDAESGPTIAIPVGSTVADAEKELILRTLDETGNNKAQAARQLDIDVKTIRNKLKAWGIDR